jgi:hypothetical protein
MEVWLNSAQASSTSPDRLVDVSEQIPGIDFGRRSSATLLCRAKLVGLCATSGEPDPPFNVEASDAYSQI